MARITVEDCLRMVPSRFELVHLAAQRVRQIREGSEYLVSSPKNEDIVVALREIAAGKITKENIEQPQDILFPESMGVATDVAETDDTDANEAAEDLADDIDDAEADDDTDEADEADETDDAPDSADETDEE